MRLALTVLMALSTPVTAQDFFTLKGHGGPIMDIAVSPTGQIATASFDNAVGFWDSTSPLWFDGHRAAVNDVVFLEPGHAASGGDDFAIILWDLNHLKSKRLEGHEGKVVSLAASPDNTLIASASWDGTIGLWPRDGGLPRFLKGHAQGVNDVVFSDDGRLLYSASLDGTIRIWDIETGSEQQVLIKHGFGVNKLILNDADGWLAYGAVDGGTRLIDPNTGELIADYTLDRRPILAMTYDKIGKQLAVGDGEGYIMVVDTETGKITRDFRATQHGPIWALAFSPNGQNIHAGGIEDIVYSWPVATMDEHGQMTSGTQSFLEDPDSLSNGERQFKRKCSVCHTLTKSSARRAGPSLHKLFGRRAGTVVDYSYSEILTGSEIVWSEETINALFDEGPDHYIPGTKMPMQRIAKKQDRDDLIAYLRDASVEEEN